MKAIQVHSLGSADVLTYTDVDIPAPGPDQVLVKVAVASVNYLDVLLRSGTVESTGPNVTSVRQGQGGTGPAAGGGDGEG